MHHPPEPHYSFTIPSLHDDTELSCRIHHPELLSSGSPGTIWRRRGIVMAHPYAPMGGSYHDRVVGIVVEEFLSLGYIIGTFNFRGAHGSKGRTSWSGKPELDDYISFAGFFTRYLSSLRPFPSHDVDFDLDFSPEQSQETAILILAGYSYGSLILKHLPPLPSILQPFSSPTNGSAASEILLRAHKLSDESNLEFINLARHHERQKRYQHEHKRSITMGGQESNSRLRKSSSSTRLRRSLDGFRAREKLWSLNSKRKEDVRLSEPEGSQAATRQVVNSQVINPQAASSQVTTSMPEVRYLLISPLTPPISTLAAPGLISRFWNRSQDSGGFIAKHISLAIYGDQDIFASSRKVHQWAESLRSKPGSRFSYVEIAGVGHFWVEHDVEKELRTALTQWEVGMWS